MLNYKQKAVVKMLDSQSHIFYLWLREHVQTPGAHLAIGGDADQVVSVLGAHHIDTVNWVLQDNEGEPFKLLFQLNGK